MAQIEKTSIVVANGQEISLSASCTLEDFLLKRNIFPKSVVVELNGEAVSPSEFKQRTICSGDRMEIVQIVAGG